MSSVIISEGISSLSGDLRLKRPLQQSARYTPTLKSDFIRAMGKDSSNRDMKELNLGESVQNIQVHHDLQEMKAIREFNPNSMLLGIATGAIVSLIW
eukprot:CAMPEP_0196573468 /NCGR_PEP_ID=MMETSP1081-20130531/3378_1 /TAXON_ID=36882 /ORGANISM="Pyramimonas amylifera, Strain CCMP720" /LENGTH=96 /DNA_ID=CAMNT_0041891197 /DNA_START=56 /DNA_END=343 /DNA_ORIENTATION=-